MVTNQAQGRGYRRIIAAWAVAVALILPRLAGGIASGIAQWPEREETADIEQIEPYGAVLGLPGGIAHLAREMARQSGVNAGLVLEIIRRESGFDPAVCNRTFGCKSGMGLMQLIPTTVRYCEQKLGAVLNPFDPVHNLTCGLWLLKNEGIRHWQAYSGPYPDTIDSE